MQSTRVEPSALQWEASFWLPKLWHDCLKFHTVNLSLLKQYTRWFKYDRDDLCVNKSQFVPVIFEPPCISLQDYVSVFLPELVIPAQYLLPKHAMRSASLKKIVPWIPSSGELESVSVQVSRRTAWHQILCLHHQQNKILISKSPDWHLNFLYLI
jgi:hypothetical protein